MTAVINRVVHIIHIFLHPQGPNAAFVPKMWQCLWISCSPQRNRAGKTHLLLQHRVWLVREKRIGFWCRREKFGREKGKKGIAYIYKVV
jgi:hypothetical protein